jgi:hypothetical protein
MNCSRWIAGMSLLAACGGSAASTSSQPVVAPPAAEEAGAEVLPAVHKRGSQKLIVAVGPAGGTLELDNGARLVIPQGALSGATEVTLAEGARTTAFANHDYERAIGPTLEVGLGEQVQSPLELSIPVGTLPEGFAEKDLTLGVEVPTSSQRYEGQAVQTRWDYLGASSRAGRAVAQLEQPPQFRVQFLVSRAD